MQPFWDVLWADTKALAVFVAPMLLLSLPTSALGGLLAAAHARCGSSGQFSSAMRRGVLVGTAAALVISMLIEFSLLAEGFSQGRRALRDAASWQLCLAAPIAAFAVAFFASRWGLPLAANDPRKRIYSLRQLFIGQLIAGLLLGWWAYTRREEIGRRRSQQEWQVRDQQAKAIFEPYGWRVNTWPDHPEIALVPTGSLAQQPIRDESLELVPVYGPVTYLYIKSDAISDAGMKHLARAKPLRKLWMVSDKITDSGVAELSELPRLRYLELYAPNLTGQSLQHLAKVKSLRYLVLSTTLITPEEQAAFRQARPNVDLRFSPDPR